MKKVCVIVGSRANYSSIKSAMRAIQEHPDLELLVVASASALLDRYGRVVDLIQKDGFEINESVNMLIEGETPQTMAQSTAVGMMVLPTVFERLAPDYVLIVGDRFETMATTITAAYMNIPIAHTMGGEVSGSIDESIRHAVTKFSHVHFAASNDAKERILKLGEVPEHVHMVGCPRIDLVADILKDPSKVDISSLFETGVGSEFSLDKPFLLVSQHPVTSEFEDSHSQIVATLQAIHELEIPVIMLWPNADAGSDGISKGIRQWREKNHDSKILFFKNLPIATYVKLMDSCACLIGNSSSGIREGAFIGTPVVNIGSRQNMRERGQNVIDSAPDVLSIKKAVQQHLKHGKYEQDATYGDGNAGSRVAKILAESQVPSTQKLITY